MASNLCKNVRPLSSPFFAWTKNDASKNVVSRVLHINDGKWVTNSLSGIHHDGRRTFFSLPSKTKQYQGKKIVGYSMEQMFEVVSDVEHYRDFVPFCQRSLVTLRQPEKLRAELVVGFPPVRESYVSEVQLARPRLVRAVCSEGRLFNHLVNHWRFYPGPQNNPRTCLVDFSVSFEFRSALHSQLAHIFFNELVRQMEKAFVEEAERRFGKPSIKTKLLSTSNAIQAGS